MFPSFGLVLLFISPVSTVLYGLPAGRHEMTTSASLMIRFPGVPDSKRVLCGGVIISPNAVLTAAHCFYQNNTQTIGIDVTLADHNLYAHDEQELKLNSWAQKTIVAGGHPIDDDLAVVFLPGPIPVCDKPGLKIARLPHSGKISSIDSAKDFYNQPLTDEELLQSLCTTSGWGITERNTYSHVPMTAWLRPEFRNITGYKGPVLVARSTAPLTRTCRGDSGSPLFCWLRGVQYLVGILSEISAEGPLVLPRNPTEADECAARDFVLVADVRKRMGQIEETLKKVGQNGQIEEGQKMCGYA